MKLEDVKSKAHVTGIVPGETVEVIAAEMLGAEAVQVTYRRPMGGVAEQILYRSNEPALALAQAGRPWSFDSPAKEFSLALEALRIQQGFLFDPISAIHTSNIEPLPHQISAVYDAMLPRQPLRFVLADDPGAGKTVMAGLR